MYNLTFFLSDFKMSKVNQPNINRIANVPTDVHQGCVDCIVVLLVACLATRSIAPNIVLISASRVSSILPYSTIIYGISTIIVMKYK